MIINENRMENSTTSKPRLRYALVAYVDFLGTKENMTAGDKYLNTIIELYERAISMIPNEEKTHLPKIRYKSFSDNIVFSMDLIKNPITKEQVEKDRFTFETMFSFVSAFQLAAFKEKYLIRGGITCGDFYLNERLVWGDALSRVVQIEEKVAIYPRIVVDEELLKLKNQTAYYTKYAELDEDDVTYIHFLNGEREQSETYLDLYSVYSQKRRNERDQRVQQKYGWVLSYMRKHLDII